MSNPILNENRWDQLAKEGDRSTVMTVQGTIGKTLTLFAILGLTLGWMWSTFWNGGLINQAAMPWTIGGAIGGLVVALLAMFVPRLMMVWAFAYAALQGLFIGGLTMIMHAKYPGLPILAACYTAATLFGMLFLYQAKIIRATPALTKGIILATVGLMIGTGVVLVLSMFGMGSIAQTLYGSGPIGIVFSIFCVGLAAFNLVIDFAVIEGGAQRRAPKSMEWFGAFGLMVTLVWLYVEILRLLAKLRK